MTVYSERLKIQHEKKNPRGHKEHLARYSIQMEPPVNDPVLLQMAAMSFDDERLAVRLKQAAYVRVGKLFDEKRLTSGPTITVCQHEPPGDDPELECLHRDDIHAYSEHAQSDIFDFLRTMEYTSSLMGLIAKLNAFHLRGFRQGQASLLSTMN